MYFKLKIDETVNRYKLLWAKEYQDKILIKINLKNSEVYTALAAMSKAPSYEDMLTEWERGFKIAKKIDDDNLPVAYGELGSYIIGGFFGAKVGWGTGGAYSEKLIFDMKNFRNYLNFSEENEYYKLALNYIKFLAEKSNDEFGFTEMLTIDGLNLLDCLRGADAYTDLFDYPEEVLKLMDFGSDFNVKFVKTQRELIKPFKGGRFNFYQIWTPKETIFISVDAYGHCRPEVFEKFGRKCVQRLIDEFDGGWLHVHSDAYRLLPNYVKLKNLVAIGLEDWIKPPRIINIIDEVKSITGNIPLMININKDEIIQKIESKTLYGNILYWINDVENIEEANKISELCRKYRSPYKNKYK